MQISVRNHGSKSRKMTTESLDLVSLLSELSINPETVIVRLNSELVTFDSKVKPGDEIEIIPVVSGG
jgi:sulfur carrier protein ThiS